MKTFKQRIALLKENPKAEVKRLWGEVGQKKLDFDNQLNHLHRLHALRQINPYIYRLTCQYFIRKKFFINAQQLSSNQPKVTKIADIIIPWYGDDNIFQLIPTLYQNTPENLGTIYLINDAFPDKQKVKKLEKFAQQFKKRQLIYLSNQENLGFIGTVNRGMKLAKNDFVLLNSDTLPQKDWLKYLISAAYTNEKIATATALSNNATIFSWPNFNQPNHDANPAQTAADLARFAPTDVFTVPTGHGFCLLIKKTVYQQLGEFDQKTYGRGYGEENDFCCRASQAGYYHIAAVKSYVVHLESQSFGEQQRIALCQENHQKLLVRYPNYDQQIQTFFDHNPFIPIAKSIQTMTNCRINYQGKFVLTILHSNIFTGLGGVELCTQEMLTYINSKHPNTNQLVYFYNQKRNNYQLLLIKNNNLVQKIVFQEKEPLTILKMIINIFSIKLVLIEHLYHHDLRYIDLFAQAQIKAVLFIHDFYYVCQVPDLIVNSKNAGFHQTNEFWDGVYRRLKLSIPSQKQWLNLNKKYFTNNCLASIIFNSEFTLNKYLQWFKIEKQNNYFVSYPDLEKKL